MTPPLLRVGTDFTGIGTSLTALRGCGLLNGFSYDHVFASDPSPTARRSLSANFPAKVYYDDIATRDVESSPSTDLYLATLPCPSLRARGPADEAAADSSADFAHLRNYIAAKQPKAFILEGVSRVAMRRYREAVVKSLEALGTYNLHIRVLDTKDHGVPQTRERLFFVGILKSLDKGTFTFPEPVAMPSIDSFLEPRRRRPTMEELPPENEASARASVSRALQALQQAGRAPLEETWIVDCDGTYSGTGSTSRVAPCLRPGRLAGYWITNRGRRMTQAEMMLLQGILAPSTFRQVVTDQELGRLLGNAGSVNVLERILVRLLPATGLVGQSTLKDRWAPPEEPPSTPPNRRRKRTFSRTPSPVCKRLRFD